MTTQNLTRKRGDTLTFNITLKDSDGVAIPITGWIFYLTLKNELSDTDANAVIQKTVTSHTNPTGGITTITVTAAETKVLNNGTYNYDLQYKKDTGEVETYLDGIISFPLDVTITGS